MPRSHLAGFQAITEAHAVDFTLAWRRLGDAAAGDERPLAALFVDPQATAAWLERWHRRAQQESPSGGERRAAMHRVNPLYIPRNHRVEEALAAASEHDDLTPFDRLLEVITHPFEERTGWERYAEPAPPEVTARYQTLCGT